MTDEKIIELRNLAAQIRIKTIRCMQSAGGGHIGGAMSIADVLAVLYGDIMRYDVKTPCWKERDRLVVSKGHSGPAVYAALSLSGFFPEEMLYTLNKGGTQLPSHCDRNKTPGIDMTTGSLGQGVSAACGMAYALKLSGNPARVFVILGDGELQEGQVWEAVQFAAQNKLSNLTILVDNNKAQLDGKLEDICRPYDLSGKFRAFGLESFAVTGYDVKEIHDGITRCFDKNVTCALILETHKGIGCKFAEEALFNHFMNFGDSEADEAEKEILHRLELGIVRKGA
ncbi:MAG: transketolase [Treponema sp.]|nr:transketolase [Treponema sp.]